MVHDDLGGYSKKIYDPDPASDCHYHLLRRYLKMCFEWRIRLSPKKFELFATSADLGDYLHENGGIRPNPWRYQAIVDQQTPVSLDKVYGCMSAVGWSRSFIPNLSSWISQ